MQNIGFLLSWVGNPCRYLVLRPCKIRTDFDKALLAPSDRVPIFFRNRRVYYSQRELTSGRRIQSRPITNWNRVRDTQTTQLFFFKWLTDWWWWTIFFGFFFFFFFVSFSIVISLNIIIHNITLSYVVLQFLPFLLVCVGTMILDTQKHCY